MSREDIQALLAAAAEAPSAHNRQPWVFHVATGGSRKVVGEVIAQSTVYLTEYLEMIGPEESRILEAFYADLGGAPIVVAVSLPPVEDAVLKLNDRISAGCAIENLLLVAAGDAVVVIGFTPMPNQRARAAVCTHQPSGVSRMVPGAIGSVLPPNATTPVL